MGCFRIPKPEPMRMFFRGRDMSGAVLLLSNVELDAWCVTVLSIGCGAGLFVSVLSVRVSFDFGGLIVFILLLLVMPIVLNWACAGMVWSNAQTVERKSMLVFMPQRYGIILYWKKNNSSINQTLTLFVFIVWYLRNNHTIKLNLLKSNPCRHGFYNLL